MTRAEWTDLAKKAHDEFCDIREEYYKPIVGIERSMRLGRSMARVGTILAALIAMELQGQIEEPK